jgi:hypothetical protein
MENIQLDSIQKYRLRPDIIKGFLAEVFQSRPENYNVEVFINRQNLSNCTKYLLKVGRARRLLLLLYSAKVDRGKPRLAMEDAAP